MKSIEPLKTPVWDALPKVPWPKETHKTPEYDEAYDKDWERLSDAILDSIYALAHKHKRITTFNIDIQDVGEHDLAVMTYKFTTEFRPEPKEDETMNLNHMAKKVAKLEGKKREVNIAQIKEVMKHTLNLLAKAKPEEVRLMLKRRRKYLN